MLSLDSGMTVHTAEGFEPIRSQTLCFTGHRQSKITAYRNDRRFERLTLMTVRLMLNRYIDIAAEEGYRTFISGLAEGIDLWAADYVIKKREFDPDIKLVGAMPFLKHGFRHSPLWKKSLAAIETNADYLLTVNPDPDAMYSYHGNREMKNVYRTRNCFMVDKSSAVIAYCDKDQLYTGTRQTINYAYRTGRKVYCFGPKDVFRIIDRVGPDIRSIGSEIANIDTML